MRNTSESEGRKSDMTGATLQENLCERDRLEGERD